MREGVQWIRQEALGWEFRFFVCHNTFRCCGAPSFSETLIDCPFSIFWVIAQALETRFADLLSTHISGWINKTILNLEYLVTLNTLKSQLLLFKTWLLKASQYFILCSLWLSSYTALILLFPNFLIFDTACAIVWCKNMFPKIRLLA